MGPDLGINFLAVSAWAGAETNRNTVDAYLEDSISRLEAMREQYRMMGQEDWVNSYIKHLRDLLR
jgi:hypothetical protein